MAPVLRIGIAGLGIAASLSLPDLLKHAKVKVTAAADIRGNALNQFASDFGVETFHSVEQLCKSPNVDVVYVSTPNYLHAEHTILAAENKKHILVEKPLALTLEECDQMIAAAQRNGVYLLCGHTHSYDLPIRAMRDIVQGGEFGPLIMINTWNYTDLLYRPRASWELDTRLGGGVVFIQAPHQVEILRLIGGGVVRSVRAMTGVWDQARPTEGNYVAYLEFEDGTPASMVYSGYAHFDSAEFHYWIGGTGSRRDPETNFKTRLALASDGRDEEVQREDKRYGGVARHASREAQTREKHQAFFGITLASCQRADIRQSPEGLTIYADTGKREVTLPHGKTGREAMLDELYEAVVHDRAPLHDGDWATATTEVCLALLESARQRREIILSHQCSLSNT